MFHDHYHVVNTAFFQDSDEMIALSFRIIKTQKQYVLLRCRKFAVDSVLVAVMKFEHSFKQ